MAGQVPVAFLAGLVSFIAPCVLPLVPGYLSAVSAVEAGRLGEPGTTKRVFLASLPFVAGFTVLFVALGAGAGLVGNAVSLNSTRVQAVAGFVVVVFGLAFVGLLPFPERLVAPGLVGGARRRGSGALLGAAFAVCAAPCMGPVLGTILVLAGSTTTVARGSVLLLAYSLGLAIPFVLAGLVFVPAMGSFRWLRDRFHYFEVGGGIVLVVFGLLLSDGVGVSIVRRSLFAQVGDSLRHLLIRHELPVPEFLRPLHRGAGVGHQPFALQVRIAPRGTRHGPRRVRFRGGLPLRRQRAGARNGDLHGGNGDDDGGECSICHMTFSSCPVRARALA